MQMQKISNEEIARVINQSPKQFCDGFYVAYIEGMFFFVIQNADETVGYCTIPVQMNLIRDVINSNVASYENKYGKIKEVKVTEPILSPIQFDRPDDGKNPFERGSI